MVKQTKQDKPPKTFSIGAFFGGLIVSYILFAILGGIETASGEPLIVLIIGCAAIAGFAVLVMAHALDKAEYWEKSAAIGLLGLFIGLVAERLLKGVKGANSSEYNKLVIGSWLVSTVLILAVVFVWALILAQ